MQNLLRNASHLPSQRTNTRQICGLEVLDYHRECVVKMPAAFTRERVSANRSQIPKPEVAREWQHLEPIADKLTPYHPDAEISILIGNNCPNAIRPREIVASEDDEPYAQRTVLSWGVIRRVCKSRDEESGERGVCNIVAASEIHSRFAFSTFDCSAKFNGVSLNDYLLQGPEFINDLLGILCRFRQESVAFI